MLTAKVFNNGRSQAVRIPKEFRVEENELIINKIGNTIMLTPKSALQDTMLEASALMPDDFMADGLPESIPAEREAL